MGFERSLFLAGGKLVDIDQPPRITAGNQVSGSRERQAPSFYFRKGFDPFAGGQVPNDGALDGGSDTPLGVGHDNKGLDAAVMSSGRHG